jgi:hypothetical protein
MPQVRSSISSRDLICSGIRMFEGRIRRLYDQAFDWRISGQGDRRDIGEVRSGAP